MSGGVSNVCFSFRGNQRVREAMHAAFLYHAHPGRAWTWASSMPALLEVYEEMPAELLELVEDVLFDRRPDATERLVELRRASVGRGPRPPEARTQAWRDAAVAERLRTPSCTASPTGSKRMPRRRA